MPNGTFLHLCNACITIELQCMRGILHEMSHQALTTEKAWVFR